MVEKYMKTTMKEFFKVKLKAHDKIFCKYFFDKVSLN